MIIKRFSRSNEDLEKLSDYELTKIIKKGENRHKTTRDLGTASGLVGAAIAGNLAKRDLINAAGAGFMVGAIPGLVAGIKSGKKKKEEAETATKILRKRRNKNDN
ncbi:MAG: hypothetical protein J6I84_04675 [Bacilli bacterium]|nr:hypothetical protein [Bacilli bacterium]